MKISFVPPPRLAEGVRNLYILAKKLRSDHQIKFAVVLIDYVLKTWINGSFPPETWNMNGQSPSWKAHWHVVGAGE